MCTCEYCSTLFDSRPQVKNPRACNKKSCQKARQRDNEKEWRERHSDSYDNEYHEHQRDVRANVISKIIDDILRCFQTGKDFLDGQVSFKKFKLDDFKNTMTIFFSELGIRRIFKFCIPTTMQNSTTS